MQAQDESVKEDTPKGQLDYGSMSALWPEMKVPLTNIDGGMFPGDKTWLDGIKEKDMSGTDYMICSYPKCGTTWVMEIMSHLVTGGDISQSYKTPLHDRVTYIDVPDARNKDTESTPTRVSMSHLWPELLPRQILEKSTKIVLVLRNPKAAIVSGFHFFQHLPLMFGPFKGTWDDYFGYAIGEESFYGSWFTHTEKWWPYVSSTSVLVVTYEGLLNDLEGNISRMANFMEKETSEATVKAIAKHVQFQSMKDNPLNTSTQCDTPMQRKGVADDWKNYFTVAQNERFDEIYKKRIQNESDLGKFLNGKIV